MTRERRTGSGGSSPTTTTETATHATPGKRTLVEQPRRKPSTDVGKETLSSTPHRPLDLSLPEGLGEEPATGLRRTPDANARLQALLEGAGAPSIDNADQLAEFLHSLPPYLQEAARRRGLPVPGLPGAVRPAMVDAGTDHTGTSHSAPGVEYTLDFDL